MSPETCWLSKEAVPETLVTPPDAARWELERAGTGYTITVDPALGDAYEILPEKQSVVGGETGVLYGTYRLLEHLRAGRPLPEGMQTPAFALRMLNHWDKHERAHRTRIRGEILLLCG